MPSSMIRFITISMLMIILIVHSIVVALFQPRGEEIKIVHGVEVVLNKPGLEYYWDKFKSFKNIVSVNYSIAVEAYAYRSHYDPNIMVIVSLQSLQKPKGKDKYIAVMVLYVKKIEAIPPIPEISFNVTHLKELAHSLGWNITIYCNVDELRSEAQEEIAYVESLAPANESAWWDKDYFITTIHECTGNRTLSLKLSRDLNNLKVRLYIAIYPISGDKCKVEVYKIIYGFAKEPRTHMYSIIREVSILLGKRVEGILVAFNLPAKDKGFPDSTKIIDALKFELQWLRENGIIKGLSDEDIYEIVSKSRDGLLGWDKRLVYYNGTWTQYRNVVQYFNGTLLKEPIPLPVINESILPKEPPVPREEQGDPMNLVIALAVSTTIAVSSYIVLRKYRSW